MEKLSLDCPSSNNLVMPNGSRKRKRSSSQGSPTSPSPSNYIISPVAPNADIPFLSFDVLISCLTNGLSNLQSNLLPYANMGLSNIYLGNDESFIALAQDVAEKLILAPEYSSDPFVLTDDDIVREPPRYNSHYEDPLRHTLPSLFPRSEPCTFQALTAVSKYSAGLPSASKSTARLAQRRQEIAKDNQDADGYSRSIFIISPPNMLVQRGDNIMEISAAAIPFWQELGLGPCAGLKDIRAVCCFPDSQQMRRAGITFLETIRGTYQSLRLGVLEMYDPMNSLIESGQYPFRLKGPSVEANIECYDEMCEQIGE